MWRFLVAFRKALWNFPGQAAVGYTCIEKAGLLVLRPGGVPRRGSRERELGIGTRIPTQEIWCYRHYFILATGVIQVGCDWR